MQINAVVEYHLIHTINIKLDMHVLWNQLIVFFFDYEAHSVGLLLNKKIYSSV